MSVALRKESVDRNHSFASAAVAPSKSLSARRAWIEIIQVSTHLSSTIVALRKESVDRNLTLCLPVCLCPVALRKESVDRNPFRLSHDRKRRESLSARRAWIEIPVLC